MTTQPSSPQAADEKTKRKFPVWITSVVALIAVLVATQGSLRSLWHGGFSGVDSSDEAQDQGANEERPKAPEIDFVTDKGQVAKLADYRGKVVLLSFWASWCGPCLEELPTFSDLARKYQSKGFEILAINVDESEEDAKAFIPEFWKNKALPFPSFFDVSTKAARAFNVDVLPANYVLDKKGRIALTGMGSSDWSSPEISESIEDLLSEQI